MRICRSGGKPLLELSRGSKSVVIEVCCSESSSMFEMSARWRFAYFGVSLRQDITSSSTITVLKHVLAWCFAKGAHVLVWLSTPCTAGSRIRHLNFSKHRFGEQNWRRRFNQHRRIWQGIRTLLQGREHQNLHVAQEWPMSSDLWCEPVYLRSAQKIGLVHESLINRCCLDGYSKTWKIMCNSQGLADALNTGKCDCERKQIRVTSSGVYSREVATYILSAWFRQRRSGSR